MTMYTQRPTGRSMVLIAFLFACASAWAQTNVSGFITNQTWTPINSPYIVTGNLSVASLVIQPGVEVRVDGNHEIEVTGIITAVGSLSDPIVFRGYNGQTWQGINFNNAIVGSQMRFCRIEDSINSGMRITGNVPTLNDITFANNSASAGAGLRILSANGTLVFNNLAFNDNYASLAGGGLHVTNFTGSITLNNPSFSGNSSNSASASNGGGGVFAENFDSLTINNGYFEGNQSSQAGGAVYVNTVNNVSVINTRVLANSANYYGGGLYVSDATNLNLFDNTINTNQAGHNSSNIHRGGGLYAHDIADMEIHNCNFLENKVSNYGSQGGGLYLSDVSGLITSTVVNRNRVEGDSSNQVASGGGVYATNASLDLRNCKVQENSVTKEGSIYVSTSGGGITFNGGGSGILAVRNSFITNNVASNILTTGTVQGGGVYLENGTFNFSNSVVAHNSVTRGGTTDTSTTGGGIHTQSGGLNITNLTVAYNNRQGIHGVAGANLEIRNAIVLFNTSDQVSGNADVTYSNVQGFAGTGNISADPQFVDQTNFFLEPTSPCIDAGDPGVAFNDGNCSQTQGTVRNDMGAYGGPNGCLFEATNQPPTANDDTVLVPDNTPISINVLANDSDPNGNPLSILTVSQGTQGNVVIDAATQQLVYTANGGAIGTDSFTYTISDGKGDTAQATVLVIFSNNPQPNTLILLMGSAAGLSGQEVVIPIRVIGFDNVAGFQFSVNYDPGVATYVGAQQFTLPGFSSANVGSSLGNTGRLSILWYDPSQNGQQLNGNEVLIGLRFRLNAGAGEESIISITDDPTPIEAYNAADTFLNVLTSPGLITVPTDSTISGRARFHADLQQGVQDVVFTLGGGPISSLSTLSSLDGSYSFTVDAGNDYTVSASKSTDPDPYNGISVFDIGLIQRHILSITPLDTPFKIIAADVNASDSVSSLDILRIQSYILRNSSVLSAGVDPWTFVSSAYTFPDPLNPWGYPNFRFYDNIVADQVNQDYIAVKYGDVSGNWSPPSAERRLDQPYGYTENTVVFTPGKVTLDDRGALLVPVTVHGFQRVSGYQFTLAWDAETLGFMGTTDHGLPGMSEAGFGSTHAADGKLATLWFDAAGMDQSLADGATIFTLRFELKKRDNPNLRIDGSLIPIEIRDHRLRQMGVQSGGK